MNRIKLFFAGLFLLLGITATGFSQTATYTVTKITDPDPFVHPYNFVDSLCDPDMYGTLAWAINKANDDSISSTITFNISGTGQHIIMLNYALPTVKADITIDGTTQPGYSFSNPAIVVDGQNNIVTALSLLKIQNSEVSGIYFRNFTTQGIVVNHSNNVTVSNCMITDIYNGPSNNDATMGIMVVTSENCKIQGNYIGTNAAGDSLTIENYGIMIWLGANNNLIGGSGTNDGNTIAYCGSKGVFLSNNSIQDKISRNLIFNNPIAIYLATGCNNDKATPDSLQYNDSTQVLSGIAEPYDSIEVFSGTGPQNANEYLGVTQADGNGNWNIQAQTNDDYFITTATDSNNNTSTLKSYKANVCYWFLSKHQICLGESVSILSYWEMYSISQGSCAYHLTECFTFHDQINGPSINNNAWPDGVYTTPVMFTPTTTGTYYIQSHDCNSYNSGNWVGMDGHCNSGAAEWLIVHDIPHIFTYGGPITQCESDGPYTIDPNPSETYDSYAWNTGETTPTITVTTSGTYSVIVTNSFGCSDTGNYTVEFYPNPTPSITGNLSFCSGNSTTLDAGSGYTDYLWNTGATTQTITVTTAGTYAVTVTDANGCTGSDQVDVTVIPSSTPTITGATFFCYGGSTTLDAGAGYDSYLWNTGATSQTISVNTSGTYSVTVTDANGCTGSDQVTVTENPEIVVTPIVTNESCSGNNDGSINLLVSGGTSPYSYLWNTGATTPSINGLPAGNYAVTVTDANNCTAEQNITITAYPNPTVSISADPSGIYYCSNETDPVVLTANASGGFSFSYLWSTSATSQSISVNPLLQSSYSVTVTNNFGCSATANYNFQIVDPPTVTINALNPSFCSGNSISIDATVTPQLGSYSFLWSNGQSGHTITVSQGGTYTVTVTDIISGCSAVASTTVTENPNPVLTYSTEDIECPPDCSGEIDLTVNGGNNFASPYTYEWTGQGSFTSTDEDLINLCEGNYLVSVTDANGCTASEVINIGIAPPPPGYTWINGGGNPVVNIYGSVPWSNVPNSNYYVTTPVIINQGATLTITNVNVEFSQVAYIEVKTGGSLIIEDGAVLKDYMNCGIWPGVVVDGNNLANQIPANQGFLYMHENSTIKNAKEAIHVFGGGIIKVEDSYFVNNISRDIHFAEYHYNGLHNICSVINSQFLMDNNIYQTGQTKICIYSDKNKFINPFDNNTFLNTTTNPYWDSQLLRGYAWWSNSTDFAFTNSSVTGFDYGIFSIANVVAFVNNTVSNCDFNDNYWGTVFSGDISVKQEHTTFETHTPLTSAPANASLGTYVNSVFYHYIENNTFNNGRAGLVIRKNTNAPTTYIYKNTFNDINIYNNPAAAIAIGHNPGDVFMCNTFTQTTTYDIYLHNNAEINSIQSAPPSAPDLSTKNLFLSTCSQGDNKLNTTGSIQSISTFYFSQPNDDSDPSGCATSVIVNTWQPTYNNLNIITGCPDDISQLTGGTLLFGNMADYGNTIDQYNSVITQKEDSLAQLVDGGDTPGLLNEVLSLTPRNYGRTAADLLNATPYLSDTVLLTFMRNPIHRPVMKTMVLWYDSPLPERGKAELNQTNIPPFFKWLLWQLQNGVNPREQRERDITQTKGNRMATIGNMIYQALRDTLPEVSDSMVAVLATQQDAESVKLLIPIYISRNQIAEAQQAIATLSSMTGGMSPTEQQYTDDLIGMFDLGIQLHGIGDTTAIDSIIAGNADWLMPIADDDNHPYQASAQVYLLQAGLHEVTMPVYLPDTMSNKAMAVAPQPADASSLNPSEFLEVAPNPANDKLTVSYVLPETSNLSLCIFDMKGRRVACKPINSPVGMMIFDTGNFKPGSYLISLTSNNKPSKFTKQVIITH